MDAVTALNEALSGACSVGLFVELRRLETIGGPGPYIVDTLEARETVFPGPQEYESGYLKYCDAIEPGMQFIWMKGTPGECQIEVTRLGDKTPDDPWIYTKVLTGPDSIRGQEYGNEESRFREAVELVARPGIEPGHPPL
jgi:hypothetical protein